jgi:hypothetical protein
MAPQKSLKDALYRMLTLQRTINAKEEYLFYVAVLFHKADGVVRTGLVLKGQQLFYRINGIDPQPDVELIPCGQMFFEK